MLKKIFLAYLLIFSEALLASDKIVLDTIVATVDGDPITWSEVIELMPGQKPENLEAARKHAGFQSMMEALITEKLLNLEAESKKINISDNEIEAYIAAVAERNSLTVPQFEKALKDEGKTIEQFKRSMRIEIIKTKLANSLMQDGSGVTDQEVDEMYKKQYDTAESRAMQVKLRQILISSEDKDEELVKNECQSAYDKLEDGSDFADLAKEISASPEAKNGGLLEVMSEKDLNPAIFGAIMTLEQGQYSKPVETELGCHIFLLEERFDNEEHIAEIKSEIRKQLDRQKMEEKFQVFFVNDIYKNHSVERKI
jgi:peptidyl-prolyl cis-trans isomerase SurA